MFCAMVKEFLLQKGVEFTDRDITQDEDALADLGELGLMTTPVIVIDGEVVIGFDRKKLVQLLAS
jgi:glutaredoxin